MEPTEPNKPLHAGFKGKFMLNVFNSTQINAAGGLDAFSKQIGNDQPIAVPYLDFTEQEWDEMSRQLDGDDGT